MREKAEEVRKAVEGKRMALVSGRCCVSYFGRAVSKLSEGDRLLIIKGDGTFLVHQNRGMKAINYQGPGSKTKVELLKGDGGEKVMVSSERRKPKEEIKVLFSKIYFINQADLKDDASLKLYGSERQLSDLLLDDLSLIEEGMKALKKESIARRGTIDILARDSRGRLAVIEVKRRTAELKAVSQLKMYVTDLSTRMEAEKVRGILCAPSITANAMKMLEREGLEFFALDYEVGNPSAKIMGLKKKQNTLSEF